MRRTLRRKKCSSCSVGSRASCWAKLRFPAFLEDRTRVVGVRAWVRLLTTNSRWLARWRWHRSEAGSAGQTDSFLLRRFGKRRRSRTPICGDESGRMRGWILTGFFFWGDSLLCPSGHGAKSVRHAHGMCNLNCRLNCRLHRAVNAALTTGLPAKVALHNLHRQAFFRAPYQLPPAFRGCPV